MIAVELDPPFDTDMKKLLYGARELMGTATDIITIADSPLARSRADSLLTAVKIRGRETGMDVMPASGLPGQKPHRASKRSSGSLCQ